MDNAKTGYIATTSDNSLATVMLRVLNAILTRPLLFMLCVLIPTVFTMVYVVYGIEQTFGSRSVFKPPTTQTSSGALNAMLGDGGSALANMMGVGSFSNEESNILLTIINSRELGVHVIEKFHLREHYKFKSKFDADLLKTFRKNVGVEINNEDMFILSVEDKDYQLAAQMNAYMLTWTDSIYNLTKEKQARLTGDFYRNRLFVVQVRMDSLARALTEFQKKNRFYEPTVQLETSLSILGEMESRRSSMQLEVDAESALHGDNTSKYKQLNDRLAIISNQMRSKNDGSLGLGLPSGMGKFAELSRQFYDLDRELKVQSALYKYLRQRVEELELEEARNIKNLIILEEPWANNKRVSPPRMMITALIFLLSISFATALCTFLAFVDREIAIQSPFALEFLRFKTLLKRLARK